MGRCPRTTRKDTKPDGDNLADARLHPLVPAVISMSLGEDRTVFDFRVFRVFRGSSLPSRRCPRTTRKDTKPDGDNLSDELLHPVAPAVKRMSLGEGRSGFRFSCVSCVSWFLSPKQALPTNHTKGHETRRRQLGGRATFPVGASGHKHEPW